MKIFGREPVVILAFIAITLKLGSAYGLDLSVELQTAIVVALSCAVAVAEVFILRSGAAFAALVNLGHAGVALYLALGRDMTVEQQTLWAIAIEGAVALFVVRPQVTAPIAQLRIEQSSVVKAA
ncbi:hypothetical protein [Streptomyces candidus]|uniref:Uncharacterized protein n=1 Tax=Streptomyces candidus TaxID=67283 RepID=A0A7X0LUB0_9ACTN|nr:hypothetical protein [Streptomyces candidus]MBB6439906.1 hypothetical protein [Streptomyces candidus]GHH57875.1 hypothetical protein GCM10018773_65810 [Streptomyces candidus]